LIEHKSINLQFYKQDSKDTRNQGYPYPIYEQFASFT
jgi:hypothetical protein